VLEMSERKRLSRVLLVEDDKAQQYTLTSILCREGFDVVGCSTATEAIAQVRDESFGIAVVDLRLPDLAGMSLLEKIHEHDSDIRVIIHTAFGSFDSAKDSVNKGAFAYVEKAGDPDVLVHHIRRASHAQIERYTETLEKAVAERTMALRESEERYRRIVETAYEGIWVLDADDCAIFVNKRMAEILGHTPEEMIGQPISAWMDDKWRKMAEAKAQRRRRGVTEQHDFKFLHKNGGEVWVIANATPLFDAEGRYVGALEMLTDITKRKQVEQALRRMTNTLNNILASATEFAIVATDLDRRVIQYNPAAERFFGNTAAEIIGRPLNAIPSLEMRASRQIASAIDIVKKEGKWDSEIEFEGPDGESRLVHSVFMPMRDEDDECIGYILIAHDVTDRRRLEDQLRQSQKMEAIGQLAGGVAHDFNNLLMVISAHTALVKEILLEDSNALESLKAMENAVDQATGVARSLLAFSRKLRSEKKPLNLYAAIERTMRMLRRVLPAGIELLVDAACEPAPWVNGDQTQLQQVILNLAVNARDAMPNGGTLHISVSPPEKVPAQSAQFSPDTFFTRLIVSDTGAGILPQLQSHIFEPFFTTKVRGQGTGLGLAVVHGIIEDHGGHIEVQSEVGKGTTFIIDLPCIQPGSATAAAQSPDDVPRGKGEMILLAEDNRQIREIVAASLASLGYQVIPVEDGEALRTSFEQNASAIQLMILDVDLPKGRGIDFLREIQAEGVETPAILITGSVETELGDMADSDAVVLSKPFQMKQLGRLVHAQLR